MNDIQKMVRIQLLGTLVFIITKSVRPSVLKSNVPEFIKTTFLSLPNFFEGFIGSITLTGIFLYINFRWVPKEKQFQNTKIYAIAIIISSTYVITQEFKIHNLGGNNVYDPNDVFFSIVGLVVGYWVIYKLRPSITDTNED